MTIVDYLGKILFPHLAPWQQQRKIRMLILAVVALGASCIMLIGLILLMSK